MKPFDLTECKWSNTVLIQYILQGYVIDNCIRQLVVVIRIIENGMTQAKMVEEIDTTKAYVNREIKRQGSVVNNTFVKMMETLRYDIELRYVKRNTNQEDF